MASHSEIAVGSVGEWVVRLEGADVPVAVLSKVRDPDGRGYDFVVQRVGDDGRPYGRSLKRGSGALRRPGTAARAFGGGYQAKQPMPRPASRSAPKAHRAPFVRKDADLLVDAADRYHARPAPLAAAPPTSHSGNGAALLPAALPSLRGRGRVSGPSSPRPAPVRPVPAPRHVPAIDPAAIRAHAAANPLTQQVIQALAKLPAHADDYMIRNAVAEVLANARAQLYWPHPRPHGR